MTTNKEKLDKLCKDIEIQISNNITIQKTIKNKNLTIRVYIETNKGCIVLSLAHRDTTFIWAGMTIKIIFFELLKEPDVYKHLYSNIFIDYVVKKLSIPIKRKIVNKMKGIV